MAGRTIRRFVVQIEMGNMAMQTSEDIASALEETARKLRTGKLSGSIIDGNGNTVGDYCARNGRGDRIRNGVWAS
jgi:hypothetical protein